MQQGSIEQELRAVRLRRIARIRRENTATTPNGWDRDCRCCMARANFATCFSKRQIKGAGIEVLIVEGEEVHAWHTDEELLAFINEERR